jgi:hypothetical protein
LVPSFRRLVFVYFVSWIEFGGGLRPIYELDTNKHKNNFKNPKLETRNPKLETLTLSLETVKVYC